VNALTKALARSRGFAATAHEIALSQKAKASAGGLVGFESGDGGGFSDWSANRSNRERYNLFRGWLYSAVNAIAVESAGQPLNIAELMGAVETLPEERAALRREKAAFHRQRMPDQLRVKTADTKFEILQGHPLSLIMEHPNPIQSRWQFVYSFVANLCLTGWGYIVGGKVGDTMEYYSLPTTWVTPIHKDGPFSAFKIQDPNSSQKANAVELTRENVAFAHLPNPSDPRSALAPSQSQIEAIRIDDHIQASQEMFFKNGIFPSVIVTIGKDPHPEVVGGMRPRLTGIQRRQVTSAISRSMSGVANYGNPAIVDGLVESITRLSATQNEMGWEKSEQAIRTRILSAFGVHPFILGEPVAVGGYAQAAIIEERFCKRVNTYLELLSSVLTNFVNPHFGTENLVLWYEPTAPHDPSLKWQNLRYARQNGDLSKNEFRAEMGFPPDENDVGPRSKLLETVGGMTGTVSIMTAMGQGMMSPDAAASLLSLFLEIPLEQAQAITGNGAAVDLGQVAQPQPEEEVVDELDEEIDTLENVVRMLAVEPKELARQIADHLEKDNPSQPRDENGRWIGSGGGGSSGSGGSGGGGGGGGSSGGGGASTATDSMSTHRDANGNWTAERQKMHDGIVQDHLKGKTPVDNPVSYMTGGGPASGKSHAMKQFDMPENTVVIDSDAIKGKLPEYKSMMDAKDPRAAAYVHEESSYLSKRILKEASEQKYNTMLDGTGDSSIDGLRSKTETMRKGGRKVEANYVTVDTEVAVARNLQRAEKTGRYVPESVVRGTHASVSRVVPQALSEGLFDKFTLWDTSSGGKATKVASAEGKKVTVHDEALWKTFLAKGE